MYVLLDEETGRICATTDREEYSEGMIEFDFPEDFNFNIQGEYRIEDNGLIYDPVQISDEQKQYEKEIERQNQMRTATIMFINENAPNLTDEQALQLNLLFDEWVKGMDCKKDHIVRHEGELYRIGQNHTAQEQWKPGDEGTTALYSQIKITEEGYEVWKTWDGVSGIYRKDQIVEDPEDGLLYKSKIDNNVWGPPHTTPDYWELYLDK